MCFDWEFVIAAIGVTIASLQLHLMNKINNQDLSKEKGYFMMRKTNLCDENDEIYKYYIFKYDLKRPLRFKLYGNGDMILISEQVVVDGAIVKNIEPRDQFFSQHDDSSAPYGIELPLNENHLSKDRLDIDVIWKLKNLVGYKYTQIMHLEFIHSADETLWEVKRKNMEFK